MKHVQVTIRIRAEEPGASEWCLSLILDQSAVEGIAREAAGIDGGPGWQHTEYFCRTGLRDALLGWAEKTLPQVERIRAERDLAYAGVGRYANMYSYQQVHGALENFARRELKSEECAADDAFAEFLLHHYSGCIQRGEPVHHVPQRVYQRAAELLKARLAAGG